MKNRILIVGTGNMAQNCPGRLGDGLILGAVADYIHQGGFCVHLITNAVAYPYLSATYHYTLEKARDDQMLLSLSQELMGWANCLVIPRPAGDPIALELKARVQHAGWMHPDHILHMGDLEAYSSTRHMIDQLIEGMMPFLDLPAPECLIPRVFWSVESEASSSAPEYLILPVAGDARKQIGGDELRELWNILKGQGRVEIAGTLFEHDRQQLESIKCATGDLNTGVVIARSIAGIFASARSAGKIISADSGLLWLVTSWLNGLVYCGKLKKVDYPEIWVYHKDQQAQVPSFRVWHPLPAFEDKVKKLPMEGHSFKDLLQ